MKKAKSEFTVKKGKEGFYIVTGGFDIQSRATSKKQLEELLEKSRVHQVIAAIKRDNKKQKFDPTYIPSTDTKWFKSFEFLWHVYMLVENLIYDGHNMAEAIELGNSFVDGKIQSNIQLPVWVADTKRKADAIDCVYLLKIYFKAV